MQTDTTPVACSLAPQAMPARVTQWRELLAHALDIAAVPGGVRFVLPRSATVADELARLTALEQSCCAWITWTVEDGTALAVHATAQDEAGQALLREWFADFGGARC